MVADRILSELSSLCGDLDDIVYRVNRLKETAEIDVADKYTKGRLATTKTCLLKATAAIEDCTSSYSQLLRRRQLAAQISPA